MITSPLIRTPHATRPGAGLSRQGTVIRCDQNTMTVALDAPSECGRCASGKGCGAGLFGLLFKFRSSSTVVPRQAEYQVGDRVNLEISTPLALKSAFIGYMLPVLAMILSATLCQYLFSTKPGFIALSGLLGLMAGLIGGLFAYSALSGSDKRRSGHAMRVTHIKSGSA